MFSAGIIGAFIVNCIRFFVGGIYVIGLVALLIIGVLLAGFAKVPKISFRYWSGTLLIVIGLTLWLTLIQYVAAPQPVDFVTTNVDKLVDDIQSANTTSNIGGGIIAAGLFAGIKLLIGVIGAGVVATGTILGGGLTLFNVSAAKTFRTVRKAVVVCVETVKRSVQKGHEIGKNVQQKVNDARDKPRTDLDKSLQPSEKRGKLDKSTESIESVPDESFSPANITVSGMQVNQNKVQPEQKKESVENSSSNSPEIDEPKHDDVQLVNVQEDDDYQLPTADLLTEFKQEDQSEELKSIDQNAKVLQETLNSLGLRLRLSMLVWGQQLPNMNYIQILA
ncbi:cell division protein FtsK [Lentilactobacillus kosonis]|uniref:Cell division protein FtsK n=1 Tax=Lentilactobacillus kosonis TaxID=2810561 RepID=A0A401FNT3_9LACO|nr:cell division protein FtsK [Lentilactobacillus kosonis]